VAGGYGAALLAATLWGLLGPVARAAFGRGVGPMELAFWRAALGGVFFTLQAGLGRSARLPWRVWPAALAFGAVGVALFYTAYLQAVATGGAALAAVLLYTAPALVAVLGPLVLGEAMTARKATAAGLAVGGAALVAFGSGGGGAATLSPWAFFWGLLASACYAAYYLFGRHYFQQYDTAAVYAVAFPFGALCLLGPALGEAGAPAAMLSGKPALAWGAIAWVGLLSTYVAYRAHGVALRRLAATRVSVVTTLEPVVAGVVAFAVFGERLGALGWVGGAVVVGAALMAAWTDD
jgi:DME family drug/metabolite transporter